MNYDIQISGEQAKALGGWASDGPTMAGVELAVDDSMLYAEQGDDVAAWDSDGSPGSPEYLAAAPIDPTGTARPIPALDTAIEEARTELIEDAERWERLACGQDTEEAEESGRLAGFVEGLEAARNLINERTAA